MASSPTMKGGLMNRKTWALVTAIMALSWGTLLLIETGWWFWPSELVHRIVMGLGGVFGVVWGVLYFFTRS